MSHLYLLSAIKISSLQSNIVLSPITTNLPCMPLFDLRKYFPELYNNNLTSEEAKT